MENSTGGPNGEVMICSTMLLLVSNLVIDLEADDGHVVSDD